MSDSNPIKTFKDFIGWAFAGLAGLVLALVSMIYSSLHAEVGRLDVEQRIHAERIKGAEDHLDAQKDSLRRIEQGVKELNKNFDEWRLHR
jgi:hypothetical protein